MKSKNSSIKNSIFFTKENFINGSGIELLPNQIIEHEVYDSVDITGEFRIIDSKNNNVITIFSLFENTNIPTAQALIDINIDKNNKLKTNFLINNKYFNKKFEYLEKYFDFFININKDYIISNLQMVVDLSFNKEKVKINDINMYFLIDAELGNKKYIFNVEQKCKEILIKYSLEDLNKIINVLKYSN